MKLMAWSILLVSTVIVAQAKPTMEAFGWEGLLIQFPALAALVWALYYLLKIYIPKKDELMLQQSKEFTAALQGLQESHGETEARNREDSRLLRATLEKNSIALTENTHTIHSLETQCRDFQRSRVDKDDA
jgi:hypothetical protein